MVSQDRRAHQRYPAWFPINVRIDDDLNPRAAMLCDISLGGALVWGFWDDQGGERAALEVTFRSDSSSIPARIVSVERQWDTVILHLQFPPGLIEGSPALGGLIEELADHFKAYQVYLAHRADDDPSLGRTATQYPIDRASA
ncbi:MAG: PilZ domain-containing protein [Dehalococcoidia bacterium]|nr:PilZ domain-containing protein [Dehalococcoidia bacterium]MBK7127472.1 PilZ domain-containing protein [Dehalococcoidia bacterium]MBK7330596.1 PilZ domain-containing protein [Dehalococcoidia bacterium]MBK9611359.1 PilZ domain-containing protein [Dehalococcoidia bacterium]